MPAKKSTRRYSKATGQEVAKEIHKMKKGTAVSGKDGKGGKVKSRKQAIAIGLSIAKKKGEKVPAAPKRAPKATKKTAKKAIKKATKKATKKVTKKTAARKAPAKKVAKKTAAKRTPRKAKKS